MALYTMGRRRVIVLLILTSILLITLDQRGNAAIDRARSGFSLMLEPFDAAARTISRPVINAWHGVVNYDDLQRENEALRAQVDNQRGAEILYRAGLLDYQDLLRLSQLLGTSSYPSTTVQVIGASPSNFQYSVQINKGSNDGLAPGMPVVNGGGLVGTVDQVFPNQSIVLLVTHPDFAIYAKVLTQSAPSRAAPRPKRTTEVATTTSSTTPEEVVETTIPANPTVDPLAPVAEPTTTRPPVAQPGTETTTVEVIRETGTLQGQGADKPLILRFIDDSPTAGRVAVGSTVQTAGGTEDIAPPGIPIGVISAVHTQSGSSALVVEVEPAAGDLSKLNFLRVLLYVSNVSGS
jgi:rod shape-determining protein MreC